MKTKNSYYSRLKIFLILLFSMVKFLLDSANSMDLNCQDNYGNTPLHAACEDGSVDVAKVLISAGANQYIENKEEKKPLEVCKPQVARAILER